MKPAGREIYYLGEIYAADGGSTPEKIVSKWARALVEDGVLPPKAGDTVEVRDYEDNSSDPSDWYAVRVT